MRLVSMLLVGLTLLLAAHSAAAAPSDVRFEAIRVPDGAEPPLAGGVWAPPARPGAAPMRRPLVVISHGGGGSYDGHADTAEALARAGFVVAAVSHAGDTYDDQSQVLKLWRRPAQLKRLVDYMTREWPGRAGVDPARIGAFGFSNGGFTVLAAAGATPDLLQIDAHCRENPAHDLCRALAQAGVTSVAPFVPPPGAWVHDSRLKAIVVAAPAFAFTFDGAELAKVTVPVQLWRGRDDVRQPAPWHEDWVRARLPTPPDVHEVPEAGHFAFLPPCGAGLARHAPDICADAPGFDRAAFHRALNAEIVAFFRAKLGPPPP